MKSPETLGMRRCAMAPHPVRLVVVLPLIADAAAVSFLCFRGLHQHVSSTKHSDDTGV
jgi:hypothetical protein